MKEKVYAKWLVISSFKFLSVCLPICTFTFSPVMVLAQTKTITGNVLDDNSQPLAGVTVSIKGKSNVGTTTDANGAYSIKAAQGDILTFSFIGHENFESRVGTSNTLSTTLKATNTNMNEVVVVGYGTTSRKNLTLSVAKVDPKNVPQAANNSVAQLLFGRAAGLNVVQQSAEPGGNINLSIRGRGNPLIVVDGVLMPYDGLEPGIGNITRGELNGVRRGGFAGLNPDDIESIEVLKDASASIYGVAAANGVIYITTKKGQANRSNVSYDGSHSFVKNTDYFEPLTASQYMKYYNEFRKDQYLITNNMVPFGTVTPGTFTAPYTDAQIQSAGVGTRWLDEVLREGSIDNHTIGINGGSDRVTYYFSGNYFNQKGTMKSSGLQKYTGKMNLSIKVNRFLTFNTSVIASKSNYKNSTSGWQTGGAGGQDFGALQAALNYPANIPIRDNTGKYTLSTLNTTGNPVSLLDINDKTNYSSLFANFSVDINIIPKLLTGKLLYGNNSEQATRDFFIPSYVYFDQQYRTRGALTSSNRQYQTMEAYLSLKKSFGNVVNIDAVAGVGAYPRDSRGFTEEAKDMKDAIGTTALSSGKEFNVSSYKTFDNKRSFFSRASFDFLDRYVLSLSYRSDGYSNFFPQNKYAGFPAASIAWKVYKESFLSDVKAINLLKLRGSIGVVGNLDFAALAYATFVPDGSVISFADGSTNYTAYYQFALNHENLQWPKTIMKNIGVDFGLFNDRISGAVDWFRDDLTRILKANNNTGPLSFIATEPINGAHQVRQGYELGLNTVNVRQKSFEWSTTFNFSHSTWKWEERFPNTDLPKGASIQDPVNAIYAFQTNGILQVGQASSAWQPAAAQKPGSPIFVDVNDDKKLDEKDVKEYNVDPKASIGLGNTFRYKNVDLGIFFYAQYGGYGYNYNMQWSDPANLLAGSGGVTQEADVWTTTNPKGTLPGIAYNESALGLFAGVDSRLEKTDFIRCRNITLGYNFNSASIAKYVKSLRFYVDVQNAFIITDYKIGDPELLSRAVKGAPAPYPMARTISLGLKANF